MPIVSGSRRVAGRAGAVVVVDIGFLLVGAVWTAGTLGTAALSRHRPTGGFALIPWADDREAARPYPSRS